MAAESWVAERAREELELLETNHPGRFDYLKLELETLISNPCGVISYLVDDTVVPRPSSSVPSTQVSSSKRRKAEEGLEKNEGGSSTSKTGMNKLWRPLDRVDIAIEKAEACLKRIRQVKRSFFR